MKKTLLFSLLLSLSLLGFGCAKNQPPKTADEQAEEARCSDYAQKLLIAVQRQQPDVKLQNLAQQSHLNKNLRKCFVLVSFSLEGDDQGYGLFDAYENITLATMIFSKKGEKHYFLRNADGNQIPTDASTFQSLYLEKMGKSFGSM